MLPRDVGGRPTRAKQLKKKARLRDPMEAARRRQAVAVKRAPAQPRTPAARARGRQLVRTAPGTPRAAQRRARAKFTHPVQQLQRSERRAIQSFGQLYAQDPKRYVHNLKLSNEGPLRHALRTAGNDTQKGLTTASKFLQHRIEHNAPKVPGSRGVHLRTSGLGSPRVGTEIIDLAANAPASIYLTGAAVKEAAQGRPQRAKKLWKDYKKADALPPLVHGDFKEALKRAGNRPITTALELSGGKAVVGRSAGAVARHAPSAKVRQAASTERPNLRLYPDAKPGEGPEIARRYSKDLINKVAQKAHERRTAKGSRVRKRGPNKGTQRRPGRDPNVDRGTYLVPALPRRLGGAASRPGAPIRSRLMRRVDTREFQKNQIVQTDTGAAESAVVKGLKSHRIKRKQAAAVQLVAEGAVRTNRIRHGLNAELIRLAREAKGLSGERLRFNREQAKHIRELRALDDNQLSRVHAAAEDYAKQQRPIQKAGEKLDIWDQTAQAKRFFPALQSRMRRPASEERVRGPRTPEEQRIMVKAVQRRLRQGKAVGPATRAAAEDALGRLPKKDITHTHGNWRHEQVPLRAGITEAIAQIEQKRLGPNPEILKRAGVNLPVRLLPLSKARRKTAGGGYAGIRRDPATGRDAHLIYYNPEWGPGARNAALWHEVAHAREVESGRALAPTNKASRAAYAANGAEARARAFAESNMDTNLYGPTPERRVTTNGRKPPGGPRGRGQVFTRDELAPGVQNFRRRVRVPSRKLSEEELQTAAKSLQRRERRGQAHLPDLPEGGPALITQRPIGRRVTGRPPSVLPRTPGKARSGVAFEEGSREVGQAALRRQARDAARAVSLEQNKRLIDQEFGVPAGNRGRYAKTQDEARENGYKRTHDPNTGELKPGHVMLEPVEVSRNRWLNVPEDVLQRLEAHAAVKAPFDPVGLGPVEAASNMWKNVVLTTAHPSQWLMSNAADLAMRAAMEGVTPLDVARGARSIKTAEASGLQGRQAAQAVARGGLFHTASQAGHAGGIKPIMGQGLARNTASLGGTPWRAWRNTIYKVEGAIEALPQLGKVGKTMREETPRHFVDEDGAMKRSMSTLLKLHREQTTQFGKRLGVDRALEAQVQRGVEDVVGRWGKVSPAMRRALGLAPFVQWLGAATRYVLITLPTHHPIKTGILGGMAQMTEAERKKFGLSYFLPRDKQVADYQMGAVPIHTGVDKYGSEVVKGPRLGRMFSFGTAAEAATGNIESFVLPQVSGPLAAAAGRSFTGEQLTYPQDWPVESERGLPLSPGDRRKVALGLAVESGVPFGTMLRNVLLEKGRPSDPTSSILTPHTRPIYNKETNSWNQRPADLVHGLERWGRPYPDPSQQLYPLGVSKQIEEAGATRRTLERWRTLPKKSKGYGFGGGSSKPRSYGFDARTKPRATAKATPTPYGF